MKYQLNPRLDSCQLNAVNTVAQATENEVVKVEAVAGSGKTTTIIESIKELVNRDLIQYNNNVLVQFNKNIATETKEKIMFNKLDKFIDCRTIHSVFFPALNVVKKFFGKLQVKLVEDNFKATSIVNKYVDAYCENNNIDSEKSIELFNLSDMSRLFDLIRLFAITDYSDVDAINEIIERYSLNISPIALQLMQNIFELQYPSRYKDIEVFTSGAFKYSFYSRSDKKTVTVFEKNLNNNIPYMYFDFTDMLYIAYKYYSSLQNELPSFEYIFIDEAQDLSKLDYCLIQLIKQKNSKLIYVGDHLQAINMFKGALPELYKNFDATYNCELNYNYRSGSEIIQYVNENTVCKNIVSGLNTQGIINTDYLTTSENKNKLISFVNELKSFSEDKSNKEKHLILSEKNDILISLYIQLAKNNVSDITLKGVAELLTSYNTCLNFQNDKMKVKAVKDTDSIDTVLNAIQLQLNMKRKTLQSLYNFDNENDYLKDTDYFNFSIIEYLVKELTSMKEYNSVKELSLQVNKILNSYDSGKLSNKITLMTVHKAKGLESDIVTIVNSDFKPKEKLNKNTGKPYPIPNWLVEQFENLKYVAFTRAVKQLNILTLPQTENEKTGFKNSGRMYKENNKGQTVRNF